MIVRCIGNTVADLTDDDRAYLDARVHVDRVGLHVGQEYSVFGIHFDGGRLWFLVIEDVSDTYPKPHFASFLEVVDERLPPDWSLTLRPNNLGSVSLLPNEWANDSSFLERLVDDVPEALETFRRLKQRLLDLHAQ